MLRAQNNLSPLFCSVLFDFLSEGINVLDFEMVYALPLGVVAFSEEWVVVVVSIDIDWSLKGRDSLAGMELEKVEA